MSEYDIDSLIEQQNKDAEDETTVINDNKIVVADCKKCGWSNSANDKEGLCKHCRSK